MLQGAETLDEIHISVRGLVELVLRHGDIDNRHTAPSDTAMQEGSRIHRLIQRRMGTEYSAEVPLVMSLNEEKYNLVIEGRADGIIHAKEGVTIDEIKGMYADPIKLRAPIPEHLAQAKCYAYIYSKQNQLDMIRVRMTYCHIPTEELRYFHEEYTFEELEKWFFEIVKEYKKWADYSFEWKRIRTDSIKGLAFPFPYREGQKELVTNVYRTIYHKKKLFLEAPTGVGKTISTVYPTVQACGQGMGDRIFYLTAKTITRTVADECFSLLRTKGLKLKSVILTAKEKICFMEEVECNPEYCPYAKGHYDRINEAVYDLLTHEESFSREKIEQYAMKHKVCPFEFCLDMSLFADAIICDYNYLFDPHVYLKRFFGEGVSGDYLFLVDEAHNLLERGREMYSATLYKEAFLEMKHELKRTILSEMSAGRKNADISGQISMALTVEMTEEMENPGGDWTQEGSIDQTSTDMNEAQKPALTDDSNLPEFADVKGKGKGKSILVRSGYADKMIALLDKCNSKMLEMKRECDSCLIVHDIDDFVQPLMRLQAAMDDYLDEQEEEQVSVKDILLDFYFEVSHFLEIYELLDDHYVEYTQLCDDGSFYLKLFCVDPSLNLQNCMKKGRSTILFSATFLPIQYYKMLLGGEESDYEVYAKSVFNPGKRALFIANDVTSKYTRRSDDEFLKIARYVEEIVKNRHGNYMVFCPSYAFMQTVYDIYIQNFAQNGRECILQNDYMTEADREAFLAKFAEPEDDRILIGFCVLGGIFSEGIDLKNDSLIGAIIVGTGIPQICYEREILKAYFDEDGESGFDYSYRYPGMNKVLQAAGRVIRTVDDVGVIALLDERFLQFSYRKMFPLEWENFETVQVDTISARVERFWNEWL